MNYMKTIEDFIDENLNEFENLSCSEVAEFDVNEFDDAFVGYLFKNYRYDYTKYTCYEILFI